MANDYTFYGYFESSGSAKIGLSDVVVYARKTSTGSLVVTAGSPVTEVGNGWYKYTVSLGDDSYTSIMSTADATVDRINAPWIVAKSEVTMLPLVENTSASVTNIYADMADVADVWTSATRTLTSASGLSLASASSVDQIYTSMATTTDISDASASAVWTKTVRTITSASGLGLASGSSVDAITGTSASTIWGYTTRTITSASGLGLASASTIADAVWDELLTGATHNIATSAGKRVRQLAPNAILDGIIVSATGNSITFDGDASTVSGAYDPAAITIMSGDGIGQTRLIYQYDGSTKTAWLDRDWKVIPEAGDTCVISSDAGREHVNEGLIRSGSALDAQLNANASTQDGEYIGQVIFVRSGTGADQARRITGYNGANQIASTRKAWNPILDNTSVYVMLPTAELDIDKFITSIWSYASRTLTSFGTVVTEIASGIWNYVRRTLTPPVTSSENYSDDYTINCVRGDTLIYVFSDVPLDAGYQNIYITAKTQYKDLDSEALFQVCSASGLLYANGASASGSASSGSVTAVISGSVATVTLQINPDITKQFSYLTNNYVYDLQVVKGTGIITTPRIGDFILVRDVTKAIQ